MFLRELETYLQVLWEFFFSIVGKGLLDLCGYLVHFLDGIAFHHSSVSLSIALLQLKRTINAEKLAFDEDPYPIAK